jgi:hypothetical protein
MMSTKHNSPDALDQDLSVAFPASISNGVAAAIAQTYVQVVCAWCGLALGFKPTDGLDKPRISHGICNDCVPKMLMEEAC